MAALQGTLRQPACRRHLARPLLPADAAGAAAALLLLLCFSMIPATQQRLPLGAGLWVGPALHAECRSAPGDPNNKSRRQIWQKWEACRGWGGTQGAPELPPSCWLALRGSLSMRPGRRVYSNRQLLYTSSEGPCRPTVP